MESAAAEEELLRYVTTTLQIKRVIFFMNT